MQKIIFTEEFCQPENLHPFTLTRKTQDIRIGILTIREKWEKMLGLSSFDKWEDDYKDHKDSVKINKKIGEDVFFMIHGNVLPTVKLVSAIKKLKNGEFISLNGEEGVAFRFSKKEILKPNIIKVNHALKMDDEVKSIKFPWDIFQMNDWSLRMDFDLITKGRKSQPISKTNKTINPSQIFIEKEVKLEHCILNATEGPIYIANNAEILEGSMIRGPFALGENSVVKMGTKIYGATTIGPHCVVGGEIKNSVIFNHTNKAHDGYLGDSVIGSHCNMGAGTTNSNLKNNASDVKVWTSKGIKSVGIKCGVFMGDYSKTSINTSLNTGTVIGVCTNVFGRGLTPKHIPHFSWGSEGIERYKLKKALADIENWKKIKNSELTIHEKKMLRYIFESY